MEIRANRNSTLDGLNSLLGAAAAAPASSPAVSSYDPTDQSVDAGDFPSLDGDWATLSTAGSSIAQAAGDAGVREDKVSAVRASLAAGTYSVPAQAVASRAIGVMLGL